MCIRKTKARSSFGSGKMIKATKGLCSSYIKNREKEGKSQSFGGTQCNLRDGQEKTKVLNSKKCPIFLK